MHRSGNNFLAHERLAIIDPASGDQPLFNEDRTICVTVNGVCFKSPALLQHMAARTHAHSSGAHSNDACTGEIYNYKALREKILVKAPKKKFATNSDCEVHYPTLILNSLI